MEVVRELVGEGQAVEEPILVACHEGGRAESVHVADRQPVVIDMDVDPERPVESASR